MNKNSKNEVILSGLPKRAAGESAPLTDEYLVKLYQKGNDKAFEELLSRYSKRIFNYIYFYVYDLELTKDLFQDTFFKAVVTIQQGKYTESGKFVSWINRIAHNLIIDYYTREKKGNTQPFNDVESDIIYHSSLWEKSIEDIIFNEQVLRDVIHLINCLSFEQKEVVRMRFFDGLSFNEIAEQTKVSVNTALGRMRYALINLRRLVSENDLSLELK